MDTPAAAATSDALPDPESPRTPDQLLEISVDRIVESRTNPRKHFDQAALEELAEDIRAIGEAWFAGGVTTAEAIQRKTAMLERLVVST